MAKKVNSLPKVLKSSKKAKAPKVKVPKPVAKKEEVKVVAPIAPVDPYKQIEPNNSGAPKNFLIRCLKCCWARMSSGLNMDLKDIHETTPVCPSCGKRRSFQCPKCGNKAMMKRIKGNS